MTRPLVSSSLVLLDADEGAVADAGGFAGLGAARRRDADHRRRAVRLFVPFGRPRQQLAVFISAGDVGEDDRRQRAGVMQAFAAPVDAAVLGEFAQHAIERRAVGVLGAELARDLARGDLAAALADEGDKFFAGGQAFHRRHMTILGPILGRNGRSWRVA